MQDVPHPFPCCLCLSVFPTPYTHSSCKEKKELKNNAKRVSLLFFFFFFFFPWLRYINNKHPVVFCGTVFRITVTGKPLINHKSPFPFKREHWEQRYAARWWLTPWLFFSFFTPTIMVFVWKGVCSLFSYFPVIVHRWKAHKRAGQAEWWQFLYHWKVLKTVCLKS